MYKKLLFKITITLLYGSLYFEIVIVDVFLHLLIFISLVPYFVS